jgi:hypothetical protein
MKRTSTLWMGLVALLAFSLLAGCEGDKKPAEMKEGDKKPAAAEMKKEGAKKEAAKGDKKPAAMKDAKPTPDATAKPDGQGGQVVTSELYKVKLTVPEGWKVDKSPTGVSVVSPDGEVQILLAGSKSQDIAEAALNDLKANLKFKDVSVEKQGAAFINGLGGLRGEGDATLVLEGDKEQQIHFVAFATKLKDQAITVLIFSSKERYNKDITKIEGILNTLNSI